MELFPAADEEQWRFIQRVIDDCDYYVLIIKTRYGSLTQDGISYTEKEYDYAVTQEKYVLAFVHGSDDGNADNAEAESADDAVVRLKAFKDKVMKGRLAKVWRNPGDLQGLVALSLQKAIKTHPAVGWVRGDQVGTVELLTELRTVTKENEGLRKTVEDLRASVQPTVADLAGLDEEVEIRGHFFSGRYRPTWSVRLSWSKLFGLVAPHLMGNPHDSAAQQMFANVLFALSGENGRLPTMEDELFQTLKIQLVALGLVTPLGRKMLIELRTVRAGKGR
jgi:hypothetical protein